MTMSQASAVSKPPPIATPLTAAISGLSRSKRCDNPANPVAGRGPRRPAACTLRSLPAEKARSPAPVMMPTHSSGSVANSFQIWSNSQCASACSAFITSGRLIVTMRMRSSSSTVQKRYSVIGGLARGSDGDDARLRDGRQGRLAELWRGRAQSRVKRGEGVDEAQYRPHSDYPFGSLPRPPDLLALLEAREAGHGFDEAAFTTRLAEAVRRVVAKQV